VEDEHLVFFWEGGKGEGAGVIGRVMDVWWNNLGWVGSKGVTVCDDITFLLDVKVAGKAKLYPLLPIS